MMGLQYQSPQSLMWLWLLIPLLIVSIYSFIIRLKKRRLAFNKEILPVVMPLSNPWRYLIKDILLLLGLAFVIIAFARPRIVGQAKDGSDKKGVETMFLVDVSNSMRCQDVVPSRIELAKNVIKRVLERRPNDKVGIIVFAGSSYVLVPLTSDLGTATEFLSSIYPNMISDQGTNINGAIRMAIQGFSPDDKSSREIVLLTDGEDQTGGAEEAAEEARKDGIKVNVLGIGSSQGGPIPMSNGYLKDKNGNVVITKYNQKMCESIAKAGGGVFMTSEKGEDLASLLINQIKKMPQSELDPSYNGSYIEKYVLFLWIGFALLLLEIVLFERKNKLFTKINLFHREK